MPGRATIDVAAWADRRFDQLAADAGLVDADHARGKVAWLWADCTERQHYTVVQALVRTLLGVDGVAHLVNADLAELVDTHLPTRWAAELGLRPASPRPGEHLVRMRGSQGRIEWSGEHRAKSSKGGKARAEQVRAQPAGRVKGKFSHNTTSQGMVPGWSSPPARDQPLDLGSGSVEEEDQISDRARATSEQVAEVTEELLEARDRVADALGEARSRLPPVSLLGIEPMLMRTLATSADVVRATGQLEQEALQERSAAAVDVARLEELLLQPAARRPHRAELAVVRGQDDQADGGCA